MIKTIHHIGIMGDTGKVLKEVQQYMRGFPHSLCRISEKYLCLKWNCKWYVPFGEPPDIKQFPIGWCKRYEPDPDAGYVMAYQLPPCVVWAVEREMPKGGSND